MDELAKNLPAIIGAAAQSNLAILALCAIALFGITYLLFARASENARLRVFVILVCGVGMFAAAITQTKVTPNAKADDPPVPPSPSPLSTPINTPQPQPPVIPQFFYRARTYCSICCPEGPFNCRQIGYAQGSSLQEAKLGAVNICVANGGMPEACSANVEQY